MAKVKQRLRDFRLSFPHHVEKTYLITDYQQLNILFVFIHNVENVINMWKTIIFGRKTTCLLDCAAPQKKGNGVFLKGNGHSLLLKTSNGALNKGASSGLDGPHGFNNLQLCDHLFQRHRR
jgi:hypothetical protein